MEQYKVIDADGHIRESADELREALDPRWRRRTLWPNDAWDRDIHGTLGPEQPVKPEDWLAGFDADGVDISVLFPTLADRLTTAREIGFAVALARAYNDWMHRFCAANPERLKFVPILPVQDVPAAVAELRRAVTELGAVAAWVPAVVPLRPDWGDPSWDPLYAEAQRLDVGVSFHGQLCEEPAIARFSNFMVVHAVVHPYQICGALCSVVVGGVLERFHKLRVAFLESGVGWVPYMMDRLDEEAEKRGAAEAPYLTRKPSEYIASGRVFFGVECEEKTLPIAVDAGLENTMLYSSDYPHWDCDWPNTVRSVRARGDLSDVVKRKMLHDNAVAFYGARIGAG
jgi:predicted TIM-barrel fold metal-dependent hydrolase